MEEEVLVLVEVTGFNPTGITPAGWPASQPATGRPALIRLSPSLLLPL